MRCLVAAAALGSLLVAAPALAQNVTIQTGNVNPGSSAQPQGTLPNVFGVLNIRRAGMGPGGFNQLCDDPLDPRLVTGECSAAAIAQ